jgi:hypothetical protein
MYEGQCAMVFLTALAKVLPIFLLIVLGLTLRRIRFLQPATVGDLKRLIVNVTLPAALFLAFAGVAVELGYLLIVVVMFLACGGVLLLGRPLGRWVGLRSAYFPSLLAGFEAGMMGYAIFGAVYGAENIYKFGIVDLGQVLFVFFVLVPGLGRMTAGAQSLRTTVVGFLKTPVILAILGGLLFHALGLTALFRGQPVLNSVLETVGLLGAMTTPLVALVIGYELEFRPGELRGPLLTEEIRLLIWVPAGLLFAWLVVGGLLGLDTVFQAAVATMVLLPAPFVIPIFMREASEEDTNYVVNTLTLGTLVTLFAYALVPIFFPPA